MTKNNPLYVLDKLANDFSGKVDFSKTAFLMVQHTQMSTVHLFEALHALGAKYNYMFHLGKIYSEMPMALKALAELQDNDGKKVQFFLHDRFEHDEEQLYCKPFKEVFEDAINKKLLANFIKFLKGEEPYKEKPDIKKIIILDDGGALATRILMGLDDEYEDFKRFGLGFVEQTTAGTRNVLEKHVEGEGCFENKKLSVPFVMVSSSYAKSLFEPEFVHDAVVKSASLAFPELEDSEKLTVGVIGFGLIGSAVANGLRDIGHSVFVFDVNRKVQQEIKKQDFTCCSNLSDMIKKVSIVFGTCGKDATLDQDSEIKKDAIPDLKNEILKAIFNRNQPIKLASVSSENKEFYTLIQGFFAHKEMGQLCLKEIIGDQLKTLVFGDRDKAVTVCRGGYPINFLPPHYSIPKGKIQVVMGCLLGGIIQANLLSVKPGVYSIEPKLHVHRLAAIFQNHSVYHWFREQAELACKYYYSDMEKFNSLSEIAKKSSYELSVGERIRITYGVDIFDQKRKDDLDRRYSGISLWNSLSHEISIEAEYYKNIKKEIDLSIFLQDKTKLQSRLWQVPSVTDNVIPREEYFEKLDSIFRKKGKEKKLHQCVLYGDGGVGKTDMAARYARRTVKRGYYKYVIWINACDQEILLTQFKNLALIFDESSSPYDDYSREPKLIVSGVYAMLQRQEKILLVFDEIQDEDVLCGIEGPAKYRQFDFCPKKHHTNIDWLRVISGPVRYACDIVPLLELKKLSLQQFKGWIIQRFHFEDAVNLAQKFDGIPLAMFHASEYILENCISVDEYIKLFAEEYSKGAKKITDDEEGQKIIFATTSLILTQLNNRYSFCVKVLKTCVSLKIPVLTFSQICSKMLDDILGDIHDALLTLKKYALINFGDEHEWHAEINVDANKARTVNIPCVVSDVAPILFNNFR